MPSILVIAPTPVPIFCTTSKTTSKSVLTQFSQFVHDISYIHTISGKQHLKKPRPIIDHPCSPTWDSPAWFRAEGFKANPAGQLNCLPVRFSKGCKQPSMSVLAAPRVMVVLAPLLQRKEYIPKPRFWPREIYAMHAELQAGSCPHGRHAPK